MGFLTSERAARGLYAFAVFAALPLCALVLTNQADPDLWMHLRAGRIMAETRDVPKRDPFSFAEKDLDWVDHEWLFQLLAYGVFSLLGAAGLMAAKGLVGGATMYCLHGAAAERAGSLPVRAFVFLASSVVAVCLGFTCRPQIVTLLGCALIVLLHQRARRDAPAARLFCRSPWILLPWSWFHGGFAAGAALYVLIALGDAFAGRPRPRVLVHAGLALAATAVNPYGFGLWRKVLEMLSSPALGRFVLEWRPFWASGVGPYRDAILAFAALLAAAFASDDDRRGNAAEWLLAAAGLAASALSVRHLLLLAIVSAPALAAGFESLRRRGSQTPARPAVRLAFSAAVLLLLAGAGVWTFYEVPVREGVPLGALVYGEREPGWVTYPKGAAEFLRARGAIGRVWSDASVGGYLVWHLEPSCRIFLDSRTDLYPLGVLTDYAAVMAAAPGWEKILARRAPDLLVLPAGGPLAAAAAASGAWRPIYRDPDYIALASGAPAYAALAAEFARSPRTSPRPPLPWLFP